MTEELLNAQVLVAGAASGALLFCDTGLSFWGGVDPVSGVVIDQHHPLSGACLKGKILAIPSGRGSCSGSGALLELMLNGSAPAALIFSHREEILTLGVLVADIMFEQSMPVICVDQASFGRLSGAEFVDISDDQLRLSDSEYPDAAAGELDVKSASSMLPSAVSLDAQDKSMLAGERGRATQVAMQILLGIANIQQAEKLIDIKQAHIDACVYNGPSSLRFAQQLVSWGAQVCVPTTLNSLSVDKRRWVEQGVDPEFGRAASALGDAYLEMGAQLSFTCAPYLLDTAPKAGEQIVWAESNAVMFANSVIGARTQKYPDFLDICIALTGRAPASGCHLDSGRKPSVVVRVAPMANLDDALWPTLGYLIGLRAGNELPIIYGLEKSSPSQDDLKAFSAAFATTSSTPMFHLAGITPEASLVDTADLHEKPTVCISAEDLISSWRELNTADGSVVDLVCLGNPHFSLSECGVLAALCAGRRKHQATRLLLTLGRAVYEQADQAGYVDQLRNFGVEFITDTCWCMINEPVIAPSVNTLMTNSAKYAHYAPGLVGRNVHFGSLSECVQAACEGKRQLVTPGWFESAEFG